MVNPKDQIGCLRMIQLNRADFSVMASLVASTMLKDSALSKYIRASEKSFGKNENYLIVSRSHPRAEQIVRDFNNGLKKIHENQKFDQILKRLLK